MTQLAIGIPTRYRFGIFLELLNDIVQYAPHLPAVISDEPLNDVTEAAIAHYQSRLDLKYFHIKEDLSQAENFNLLLKQLNTKYILMMHDDDRLLPNSLDNYSNPNCFLEEDGTKTLAVHQSCFHESNRIAIYESNCLLQKKT